MTKNALKKKLRKKPKVKISPAKKRALKKEIRERPFGGPYVPDRYRK